MTGPLLTPQAEKTYVFFKKRLKKSAIFSRALGLKIFPLVAKIRGGPGGIPPPSSCRRRSKISGLVSLWAVGSGSDFSFHGQAVTGAHVRRSRTSEPAGVHSKKNRIPNRNQITPLQVCAKTLAKSNF